MVITTGHNGFAHHRQNRRRERPGSRTRRTISRKSSLEEEYEEGILIARDSSVILPYNRPKPSPLLRENFDRSWQRWQSKKAKQADDAAMAEIRRLQLEQYQLELFGGDGCNDDEIFRLGVLYNEADNTHDEFNSVACELPSEHVAPVFVIRQGKPRRSRRPRLPNLPLYLSLSDFSTDPDIARLLSSSTPHTLIQHRDVILSTDTTPQSLPQPSALESLHALNLHSDAGDWTLIETSLGTPKVTTPSSEPETWIILGDDL